MKYFIFKMSSSSNTFVEVKRQKDLRKYFLKNRIIILNYLLIGDPPRHVVPVLNSLVGKIHLSQPPFHLARPLGQAESRYWCVYMSVCLSVYVCACLSSHPLFIFTHKSYLNINHIHPPLIFTHNSYSIIKSKVFW